MILVISPKTVYAAQRLIAESQKAQVPLEILSVEELAEIDFKVDVKKYSALYIRNPYLNGSPELFPQIIKLAKQFKIAGKKVVDAIIADGNLGQGKWVDYQVLMEAGLPIPMTQPVSVIARSAKGEAILSTKDGLPRPSAALGARNDTISYPLILKWTYGFKGKNVFYIKNEAELNQVLKKYPRDEILVQEFVPAEYEYKIITVGYKALPVILRFAIHPETHRPDFNKYLAITSPTTPSASRPPLLEKEGNTAAPHLSESSAIPRSLSPGLGGSTHEVGEGVGVDQMQKIIHLAEQSSLILKRELAKVDILESKGKFYILEVNRFPGLDSFEELTKFNVAKEFLGYLQKP